MAKKKNWPGDSMDFKAEKRLIASNMSFAASESYKLLRTNLMFSFSDDEKCRVIGMTSSFRGEGKSLTAVNLAFTMAEAKKKVLLIEGDMRLPTMAQRLELKKAPGLSNLLVGMNSAGEVIQSYEAKAEDGTVIALDALVTGDVPPNPSELLGSERMRSLISALRKYYEYIILDLPPVTAVTDALVASKLVDGMAIVVRNGHAVRGALAETILQLKLVDTHIVGFVFNGASDTGNGYYRRRYYKKSYRNDYYGK